MLPESKLSGTDDGAPGSKKALAIITCGILRDEIEAVIRQRELDYPILFLSPAPCIDYGNLEKQLIALLKRAARTADRTLVVIGKCHPDIDRLLAGYGASRLSMANCFEALLGAPRMKEILRETNTFFTSPSWLKHWRRAFKKGMKWDVVDVRQNFGVYERILILDAGVTPYSDEEVLEFYDYTQVPVEIFPVDLGNFASLLAVACQELIRGDR